ncbi:hypothetical protein G7Y89_g13184 [Cudoniella acicularis]|uniref:cutinase n=1 Tax=Cudoniella acicularis TaxID=354080 RepID=A0A8H4VWB0_9HELO|nr:hypothetical protein G7Y89_g13184 [Cudoniella acicularis]
MDPSIGIPFIEAIAAVIGAENLAVQGLDYPASYFNFVQGAEEVHIAAQHLTPEVAAQISSIVLFGDPRNGIAVEKIDPSKVLVICHEGDLTCKHPPFVTDTHRDYANDAPAVAVFAVEKAGL